MIKGQRNRIYSSIFLGAKAPLELAHVKKNKNKNKKNGTENFLIAYDCFCGTR